MLLGGKIGFSNCLLALFETIWFLASIWAVVVCVRYRLHWAWPASYVAFMLFVWAFPFLLMAGSHGVVPVIPKWAYAIGLFFGLYFVSLSIAFARRLNRAVTGQGLPA